MEAIKWANEEGLTLKLTRQELEELASPLEIGRASCRERV